MAGVMEFLKKKRLGMQYGYETYFKPQDKQPVGRVGVVFAHMGVPEDYDFAFYNTYMTHLFRSILPGFVAGMVLADKGTVLSDPENPVPRDPFTPRTLMNARGETTNRQGVPYVDCEVKWVPPRKPDNPWDNGYFLYTGDGKFGAPCIAQKAGCKVVSWYYHSLLTPSGKCSYEYQVRRVYEDAQAEIRRHYDPAQVLCRLAPFVYRDRLAGAIEDLLAQGCDTIVYCSFSNPVFSDFEEYHASMPFVHRTVDGRARVIFTDQCGTSRHLQQVRSLMLQDQLDQLPEDASVFVILSRHGHPFKKETMDWRGAFCRKPLEEGLIGLMEARGGRWDFCWSNDEFTEGIRFETRQAYLRAIDEGYDYAIEIPTDFLFENTDLMIHHARKKFTAFSEYSQYDPVDYPDWDQPLVRTFREKNTTGIYLGVPVGDRYRPYVVRAVVDSVRAVLDYRERHQIGH
jgi:hypothetical protein